MTENETWSLDDWRWLMVFISTQCLFQAICIQRITKEHEGSNPFFCLILVQLSVFVQEQERADILEQYRSLSQEAERYETQTHHLESEGSNLRLELLTRDSEIRRLRDKCEQTERLVQEVCSPLLIFIDFLFSFMHNNKFFFLNIYFFSFFFYHFAFFIFIFFYLFILFLLFLFLLFLFYFYYFYLFILFFN